jgi:ribosomal protein S18 acetylase RimI-like enzyme
VSRPLPGGAVTVRIADPAEYAAAGLLTVDAYVAAGVVTVDDPYRAVLADAPRRAALASLHVAVDADGTLLGTVTTARHGRPYADLARAGELEVRMLAVAPAVQRAGVATTLVHACAAVARAAGDDTLVISVTSHNANALAFYRRLGFHRQQDRDRVLSPALTLVTLTAPVG